MASVAFRRSKCCETLRVSWRAANWLTLHPPKRGRGEGEGEKGDRQEGGNISEFIARAPLRFHNAIFPPVPWSPGAREALNNLSMFDVITKKRRKRKRETSKIDGKKKKICTLFPSHVPMARIVDGERDYLSR